MGIAYQIRDQERIYFMTFQVVGWADIFTRMVYRDILIETMEYYQKNKGLLIFAYVIMSNHMHVVWKSKNGNLSDLVRDYKKRTAKLILNEVKTNTKESRKAWLTMIFKYHAKYNKRNAGWQFWTHANHAVELSNNFMIDQRINYIHQNPRKAGLVEKIEDYVYSSAKFYVVGEGLIKIDEI